MPEVQLNNRSDRRVAQRFDAKRQSKREKQMMMASPNASKYNAKKSRKKASRKSKIASTTPIASVKPSTPTPSGNTSATVEMSLVHQQPAKQSSGQEHDSSFETETDLPVQEQAVFELEEEQKPKILDEEAFDVEEETLTEGEELLVKALTDTVENEELADESSFIATPKEERVVETTSSLENENDNHPVDNKADQKQDDGLSDKIITAQQEEPRSNESAVTVQKASHASKNDTIQNKQVNKELSPTHSFVFPEAAITNSPAVSIELPTVSPTKKKNAILRLFKRSAAHIIEKNKRVKKELLHTKQLVFSRTDITNSSVASIEPTKESSTKKTNIISRLYKKSVKACDIFINDQIQLIGKANRIGIISNKKNQHHEILQETL
ncbi:uncharacterized protein EV154DRAFT_606777 [Mucor mucedo]|uniref:uncharacterized protein n=1 Tax=Mucor mucedo TaxID=29922 RepID=UPI0022208FA0|nr:uncharacterized protein EV154DRAFT_606777 [Mucor mucedo]KAI7875841.1 hypothetical protein EV154DRAFT_606777 [Mucor mucedo]